MAKSNSHMPRAGHCPTLLLLHTPKISSGSTAHNEKTQHFFWRVGTSGYVKYKRFTTEDMCKI